VTGAAAGLAGVNGADAAASIEVGLAVAGLAVADTGKAVIPERATGTGDIAPSDFVATIDSGVAGDGSAAESLTAGAELRVADSGACAASPTAGTGGAGVGECVCVATTGFATVIDDFSGADDGGFGCSRAAVFAAAGGSGERGGASTDNDQPMAGKEAAAAGLDEAVSRLGSEKVGAGLAATALDVVGADGPGAGSAGSAGVDDAEDGAVSAKAGAAPAMARSTTHLVTDRPASSLMTPALGIP
jgi:hypothetical protein